jgi:fluoride exporter
LPYPPARLQLSAAIAAGGVLGALARAGLERAFLWDGHSWPWPTFCVNVVGTLLLGFFVTRLQERLPPSTFRRPLLGTGFCGALTTFSTLQLELLQLVHHDRVAMALSYGVVSLAAGFLGCHLAAGLSRRARLR